MGRLQDGMWRGQGFLAFGRFSLFFSLCLFASLTFCFFFFFFFGEGFGGKEIEVPRLDGRTLHFGAGKCRLGTGLGRRVKAEKPSSRRSPFGLGAAG